MNMFVLFYFISLDLPVRTLILQKCQFWGKDMTHLTNNSMIVEFLNENKEINMCSVNF